MTNKSFKTINQIGKFGFLVLFVIWNLLFGISLPVYAQQKAVAEDTLTKGEAVMLLSATDFMKQKIGELLSWTVGYDITKVNRVKLTPTINYIKAVPRKTPPDGRTIVDLTASVDDPGGLNNISGVRADLSAIGRLPNAILVDNGLYGDQKSGDGVFTLQTTVALKTGLGSKDIPVAAANKKGWLALAKTTLEVKINPLITEARLKPERALADGRTLITITVKVDYPGRIEDIDKVTADLRALRLEPDAMLALSAGTDSWARSFTLSADAPIGSFAIPIRVINLAGGMAETNVSLTVYK